MVILTCAMTPPALSKHRTIAGLEGVRHADTGRRSPDRQVWAGLSCGNSSGCDTAIKLDVAVGHALRIEALAGALEGTIGIIAAQLGVIGQHAEGFGEAYGIVGTEIDCGISPQLAQRRDIVEHQRAAG